LRRLGPQEAGSRCQRVSPVRLMRVIARRQRSRQTPKAEIWLLPVLLRRQGVLHAARTPLRILVKERDAQLAATEADCRTAARRSRGNDTRKDKSDGILLAPSMTPRLLRDRRRDGTKAARPHCELSTRALHALHEKYLGNVAQSRTPAGRKAAKINRHFTRLILRYGALYAYGEKTNDSRPANHLGRLELFTELKKIAGRARRLQVNLPRRIPRLLKFRKITNA